MARKKRQQHEKQPAEPVPDASVGEAPVLPSVNPADHGSAQLGEAPRLPFQVVGIGASAGGVEAFKELFEALPDATGMAFVVVPHLAPSHHSMLAEILQRLTHMPVREVQNNVPVEADHVYVIPPGKSMLMADGLLQLAPRVEVSGRYHPIDHFLRSLAEEMGHGSIGVILSGTASDGTLGMEEIQAAGGITFAQDDTAEQTSMPRSAVAAGCVDFVLSPREIARELGRISKHPYVRQKVDREALRKDPAILRILEILRTATGVDFSQYKNNTLHRRITRRMVLHKHEGLESYARMLETLPAEVEALYQDILISVTSFFRNPEGYEALKSVVFPSLVQDRSRHEQVRVWALGCSTGEEAYSVAMAFSEYLEANSKRVAMQIFATDLNGAGIEKARAGIYSKGIAQDVSPERLRRFFVEIDGNYRISKAIRDMVVFARQNVLADPPFSPIDLVACRNLLIYLEPALQKKLIPMLHYALRPQGFLWLGSSETIGSYRDLFNLVDPKHKFYQRKPASRAPVHVPLAPSRPYVVPSVRRLEPREQPGPGAELQKEADRLVLARYAPAGVVLDGALEIVQFRGDTSPYLSPPPGKPSHSLLKMLREGLLVPVRGAVHRARREQVLVREEGLRVKSNGGYREVDVAVIPIKGNGLPDDALLLVFEEPAQSILSRARQIEAQALAAETVPASGREGDGNEAEFGRVKQELASTRDYLQSVIEQQEAANEELQSANEEVQSANEELQSINEELETSKEEIQSSNEELATVNDELQNRNVELSHSNNDLLNLLSSVQMAIVMLGPDMRIRRFTPAAEKLLNLIPADVGRPLGDIKLNLNVPDLEEMVLAAIDTVTVQEREVQDRHGRWQSLRVRPYRTLENKIDGAVLLLVDVDRLKRTEQALRESEKRFEVLADSVPVLMWIEDLEGLQNVNRAFEEFLGLPETDLRRSEWTQHVHPEDRAAYVAAHRDALDKRGPLTTQFRFRRADGEYRWMKAVVQPRVPDGGEILGYVGCAYDITDLKQAEERLREDDRRKDEFLATLSHELRNPLSSLCNVARQLTTDPGVPPSLHHAHQLIERQTRNMARLVDDLLDATRISHGTVQLQTRTLDLAEPLANALAATDHLRREREQKLETRTPSEPVPVEGDSTRLEQVFINLLTNASKFTPPRGHVWVELEKLSVARVRVRDDGEGIDSDSLPRIFELFVQGARHPGTVGAGVGIGLTLAKHLTELHGGTIRASSAGPDRGSEFLVELPLSTRPLSRRVAVAPAPSRGPGRRVLVVDDNDDSAQSERILLERAGHEVRVADGGPAALELAKTFRPDLVLLDIGLPGKDGHTVAQELRALPSLEGIRIAAVTGFGRESDRRRSEESGFVAHLTKPVDPDLLLSLIARLT